MRTLYWLTRDLRLDDNPALRQAAQACSLTMVYCVDRRWFSPQYYQLPSLGRHRWNFIQESLQDFNQSLLPLGQQLRVEYGETVSLLSDLVTRLDIQRLLCMRQLGHDERRILQTLATRCPGLQILEVDSYTLFDVGQLPWPVPEIPDTYSKFRRKAEKIQPPAPIPAPQSLPPNPLSGPASLSRPDWVPGTGNEVSPFRGGEQQARVHVQEYFAGDLPLSYKEVRNSLDGWTHSSKMSPWLNLGCLSPRRLLREIEDYEQRRQRNESTYWLYVELLWREYFQWLALKLGSTLFRFRGTAERAPLQCFYPERFQKWCHGSTPYALVNACMNQLASTGYLSNRGRQIAASCLINELELDWRYGAAWFEQQLLDYDVGSNWGNWQYIAGVGADARGGRHFNLEKQTRMFDADGSYRARWAGEPGAATLDSLDAADWPIDPGSVAT